MLADTGSINVKNVNPEGDVLLTFGSQIPEFSAIGQPTGMGQRSNQFSPDIEDFDRALRWQIDELHPT
ncbi:MAG: hypothetical protein HKN13_11010, partial [Rhodothermales bacterium]|nr:hypothetical protein [Rhodothermales bacterium]